MYENIEILKGKTLRSVLVQDDQIDFTDFEGHSYRMYHNQDCCESVFVEDVVGDIDNIIGSPILMAEEVASKNDPPLSDYEESYTWTYYKLATIKGSVTIRWYGSSNGYYSESVNFISMDN